MSVEIPLTRGYVAIVDDEDVYLAGRKWHASVTGRLHAPIHRIHEGDSGRAKINAKSLTLRKSAQQKARVTVPMPKSLKSWCRLQDSNLRPTVYKYVTRKLREFNYWLDNTTITITFNPAPSAQAAPPAPPERSGPPTKDGTEGEKG